MWPRRPQRQASLAPMVSSRWRPRPTAIKPGGPRRPWMRPTMPHRAMTRGLLCSRAEAAHKLLELTLFSGLSVPDACSHAAVLSPEPCVGLTVGTAGCQLCQCSPLYDISCEGAHQLRLMPPLVPCKIYELPSVAFYVAAHFAARCRAWSSQWLCNEVDKSPCRRANSIASEREEELENMSLLSAREHFADPSQSMPRIARRASSSSSSSREVVEQATRWQRDSDRPVPAGNGQPIPGIRRGRGSVPAVPKKQKQSGGLDRDLRDEIDAW